MIRLVVGATLPDRGMASRADEVINLKGVMTRPDTVRTSLGDGWVLHVIGMIDTMMRAESWFRAEWTARELHDMNRNMTSRVDQDPQARCFSVGISMRPSFLTNSGWVGNQEVRWQYQA